MWFKGLMINPQIISFLDSEELEELVEFIKDTGLQCIFFATQLEPEYRTNIKRVAEKIHTEPRTLTAQDIGAWKGSRKWIEKVVAIFNTEPNRILILGRCDIPLDWRTAINGNAMFVGYSRPGEKVDTEVEQYGFYFHHVHGLIEFIELFFADCQYYYTYSYDWDSYSFRCLLDAGSEISTSTPEIRVTLRDIFTYEARNPEEKNRQDLLRFFLTLYFMVQLFKEGFLKEGTLVGIYPSHRAGKIDDKFSPYLRVLKGHLVKNFFDENLIVRTSDTQDKSLLRASGQHDSVDPQLEFNTLEVKTRRKIDRATVVIFDDFCTTGLSLECARLKLTSFNPSRVVLCAVGKYGNSYTIYSPTEELIKKEKTVSLSRNIFSEQKILESLSNIVRGLW